MDNRLNLTVPGPETFFTRGVAKLSDGAALRSNVLFANMVQAIREEVYRVALTISESDSAAYRTGLLTGLRRGLELMNVEEQNCMDDRAISSESETDDHNGRT